MAKRLINGPVLENWDMEDEEELLPAVAEALEPGKSEKEMVLSESVVDRHCFV